MTVTAEAVAILPVYGHGIGPKAQAGGLELKEHALAAGAAAATKGVWEAAGVRVPGLDFCWKDPVMAVWQKPAGAVTLEVQPGVEMMVASELEPVAGTGRAAAATMMVVEERNEVAAVSFAFAAAAELDAPEKAEVAARTPHVMAASAWMAHGRAALA